MSYHFELFAAHEHERYRAFLAGLRNIDTDERRAWFIFANPLGGVCAIAHRDGELAARCYVSGRLVATERGPLPAYEIGDTSTEPQHQRKGLFSQLVVRCRDWAFEHGGELVYGTPNAQSSPGYQKLGFDFVRDARGHLLLAPIASAVLSARTPALAQRLRGEPRDVLRAPWHLGSFGLSELSFEHYAAHTLERARFNVSSESYLRWRLRDSSPHMRFFRCRYPGGDFVCALRRGQLGRFSVLVAAESFELSPPGTSALPPWIAHAVARVFYRAYDGIHMRQPARPGYFGQAQQLARGAARHRLLPICYVFRSLRGSAAAAIMNASGPSFQLSDCDIG